MAKAKKLPRITGINLWLEVEFVQNGDSIGDDFEPFKIEALDVTTKESLAVAAHIAASYIHGNCILVEGETIQSITEHIIEYAQLIEGEITE